MTKDCPKLNKITKTTTYSCMQPLGASNSKLVVAKDKTLTNIINP